VVRVPGLAKRGRAPAALDEVARSLAPDVVHVHTVLNPAALEWAAARGAVMTVQDHRYFCPGRGRWTADGRACRETPGPEVCGPCFDDAAYFHEMRALTGERLDAVRRMRVAVLSRYMRDEMGAAGVPGGRIHVVPPFVDPPPKAPPASPRTHVLFAGRLVAAKGVLDAVAAWRRSGVDLPLVMAGTGPLRRAAEAAGARVLGWQDHADMATLYRSAAAVLMPSRWQEPFGIAGLEALAHGAPVVAWHSGGVADWHPGPLVAWGDVDGLAARLAAVVREPPPPSPVPAVFTRAAALAALDAIYRSA
jgi:glycosyltransferase involved in cell wall biosynthesis